MKKNKKIAVLLSALILASVTTSSFTTAFAESSSTVANGDVQGAQAGAPSANNPTAPNTSNSEGASSTQNAPSSEDNSAPTEGNPVQAPQEGSTTQQEPTNQQPPEAQANLLNNEIPSTFNSVPVENKLAEGLYTIGNNGSVMDMYDAGYGDGVAAGMYQANNQNNQLFKFVPIDSNNDGETDYYNIIAVHSQKALTIGTDADKTVTQEKLDSGNTRQQWKVINTDGVYTIKSVSDETLFITFDATKGIICSAQSAETTPNQNLTLTKEEKAFDAVKPAVVQDDTYGITSKLSGKILGLNDYANKNGTIIGQYALTATPTAPALVANTEKDWHKWNVKNNPDGTVTFQSTVTPSKVLDVNTSTGKLQLWDNNGKNSQKWIIGKDGNEGFTLKNVQTGKAIDLKDQSVEAGDHVITANYTGNASQRWNFTAVTANGQTDVPALEDAAQAAGLYTIGNGSLLVDMYDAGYGDNVPAGAYHANRQNNQLFDFVSLGSNQFKIVAVHSQKALTLNTDGTIVQTNFDTGNNNQKWKVLKDANDGSLYIENVGVAGTALTFDAQNGVIGAPNVRADNQKIALKKQAKIYDNVKKAVVADGTFELATNSGFNLGIQDNGNTNGTPIGQYSVNTYDSQRWNLKNNPDGTVTFESASIPSKVLDLNVDTGKVSLWQKNGGRNQKWMIKAEDAGKYSLKNLQTNKALDVQKNNEAEEGDYVITSKYDATAANQKWTLTPSEVTGDNPHADDEINMLENGYYTIGNGGSVVDMYDAGYGENVPAGIYQANNQNNQLFNFVLDGETDNYEIQAVHSQKALTLHTDKNHNQTVVQSTYTADPTQQWTVTKDVNGNYYIENASDPGKALTFDANNGLVYTSNTRDDNQKLALTKQDKVFDNVKEVVVQDGIYHINSQYTGMTLGILNNGGRNGQPIYQYTTDDSLTSQKWDLKNNPDGTVTFVSLSNPGKVLDLNVDTGKIGLWDSWGGANQKWTINKEADGSYTVKNVQTGNVLDLSGENQDEGGLVIAYPYSGNENQLWNFAATDDTGTNPQDPTEVNNLEEGYYTIGNGDSVMDMFDAGYSDGVPAGMYQANNQNNQLFQFIKDNEGTYEILAVHSQKALTVHTDEATGNKTVVQSTYTGDATQQWTVTQDPNGDYHLTNAGANVAVTFDKDKGIICTTDTSADNQLLTFTKQDKVFDNVKPAALEDGDYTINSLFSQKNLGIMDQGSKNGQPIYQYDGNDYDSQKWNLKNNPDGTVTFESVSNPGKVLDLNVDTGKIGLWQVNGGDNQKWTINEEANGGYSIKNVQTGNVLDLYDNNQNEGGLVIAYPYSGNQNQIWDFTATTPSGVNPQDTLETNKLATGYYTIANGNSVVDMTQAGYANDVVAGIYPANNQNNQLFNFVPHETTPGTIDYYNIIAVHSQKALSLATDGTITQQKLDPNDAKQKFNVVKTVNGSYYIEAGAKRFEFDAENGTLKGANKTDANNQMLQLSKKGSIYNNIKPAVLEDGVYTFKSKTDGKGYLSTNGTILNLNQSANAAEQEWVLSNSQDGTVSLKSNSASKQIQLNTVLHETPAFKLEDNNLTNKAQRWTIKKIGDNYFICNAKNANQVIGIDDSSAVTPAAFNASKELQQWVPTAVATPQASTAIELTTKSNSFQVGQKYHLEVNNAVTSNVKFDFSYKYNGGSQVFLAKDSTVSTYDWTPMDPGTYVLQVDQKINDGATTHSTLTIEVKAAPEVQQGTLSGIDVSEWQGDIDWKAVKESGKVQYAMLRTGYGKETDHDVNKQKDKKFDQNYAGATAQGIPVGAYHYSYAKDQQGGHDEAAYALKLLDGKQLALPVAYDIEDASVISAGKDGITAAAIAFCGDMKDAGYQAMIYCNPNFANNYLDMAKIREANIDVWIANYGVNDYQYPYLVRAWQYSSTGSIPGINGNVDLNTMYLGSDHMGKTALPKGQQGKIKEGSNDVAVRSTPSKTGDILYLAQDGYDFTILSQTGTYWKVSFGGNRTGYIDKQYIALVQ